jgi:hypothetical protein
MRSLPVLILTLSLTSALNAQEKDPQVEFTSPTKLLAADGNLSAWGWGRRAQMIYNRDAIPAERLPRIKEWEHYTVMSPKFTAGVTIAQIGGLTFGSVEVIDYAEKTQKSAMFFGPQSKDRSIFPADPYGATQIRNADNVLALKFEENRRLLTFHFVKTASTPAFDGAIELANERGADSIALARPFEEPGHFFYENKIFGMHAKGDVTVDGKKYVFPADQSFAIFDWGRGIWPRKSQWFWGQAAGKVDGRVVAINLGDGYGDDTRGTANAILVDGKLHKLRNVKCDYDPADRMKPWKFTSDDGRLKLTFQPNYHQESKQEILIAATELHKIHGAFSGTLIVDGKPIEVKDLQGFAEHMSQRW